MNYLIPDRDAPCGIANFEPHNARAAAEFLRGKVPHVAESEQAGMLAAMRELDAAARTEAHFEVERFTPPWYVPGWVQAA